MVKKGNNMDVNFEELAIDVGYSYLNAGKGYWEDGEGKVHSYDSMDNEYLENCINFVDRGIKEIKNNENGITNDIKRYLNKVHKDTSDKDVEYAKKQIIDILKEKKDELKEYKKKRKSY